MSARLWPALALLILSACGSGGSDPGSRQPAITAAELDEQTVLTAAEYLAAPPYRDADSERGERLYLQCRACHAIEQGGRAMIGPNLYGIFGSVAGSREGFQYSEALGSAEFRWTPRAMDAWITNPARFLPGQRMSYAGMADATDRRDLITWMLRETVE